MIYTKTNFKVVIIVSIDNEFGAYFSLLLWLQVIDFIIYFYFYKWQRCLFIWCLYFKQKRS